MNPWLNANFAALRDSLRARAGRLGKSPASIARIGLGVLIAANVVAAAIAYQPWAGTAEDIEVEVARLRQQIQQKQAAIERTRTIVDKVRTARADGDLFMARYLMNDRTVSSTLLGELEYASSRTGIKQREITFSFDPLEGSENLSKAVITATYEGNYTDLVRFMNQLDRSPRFFIVESLGAAPQQGGQSLGVTVRISAFVREGGPDTLAIARDTTGREEQAEPAPTPAPPAAAQVRQQPLPQQPFPQQPFQRGGPGFPPGHAAAQPPAMNRQGPSVPPLRGLFGRRRPGQPGQETQ